MDPEFDPARVLLDDAKLLLVQGRFRSAVSRGYYASYHACIALMEYLRLRPGNYLGRGGGPALRWEHGIITASVASDPPLSRILTRSVAGQVRWQYLQRIRGDYRAQDAVSSLAARTSVGLIEQVVQKVKAFLNAQRP